MIIDINAPAVGESIDSATISSIFVKVGDIVKKDQILMEYETEKATLEIASPSDGVISEVLVDSGQDVKLGDTLIRLNNDIGAGANATSPSAISDGKLASPEQGAKAGECDAQVCIQGENLVLGKEAISVNCIQGIEIERIDPVKMQKYNGGPLGGDGLSSGDKSVIASGGKKALSDIIIAPSMQDARQMQFMPSAERIVNDHNIDLSMIIPTGLKGRVTKTDVLNAMEKIGGACSIKDAAKDDSSRSLLSCNVNSPGTGVERESIVKMSKTRQTIASRLKKSQETAAILTTFNEVDMSAVFAIRKKFQDIFMKKYGVKLGLMSFFVKACTQALKKFPIINASVNSAADSIIYKNYYNLGIAIGVDSGLVVPVINDVDKMSFDEIERSIADFALQARESRLPPSSMNGGTFTITNGGAYGSLLSTPIINPPQSAILGMHNIVERAVVVDGKIDARPMMYIALSYDHRIIDGKDAVSFLIHVRDAINDPMKLLFEI